MPDNDTAGNDYCEAVQSAKLKCLRRSQGQSGRILPDLPPKGDIVDWIDTHGDTAEPESMRAEIETLVEATTETKLVVVKSAAFVTVAPGTLVKAGDRGNYGTVVGRPRRNLSRAFR